MGGRSRSSQSSSTTNNTSIDNSIRVDNTDRSVDVGDNSVGQVGGFGNNVTIERIDDEIVESALESLEGNTNRAFDFGVSSLNFAGEAVESINESNEDALRFASTTVMQTNQQAKESIGALEGIIERQQIGAAATSKQTVLILASMAGIVLVVGFLTSALRKK